MTEWITAAGMQQWLQEEGRERGRRGDVAEGKMMMCFRGDVRPRGMMWYLQIVSL